MQLGRGRGGGGGGGVTSQLSRLLELARRVRHSVVDQVGGGRRILRRLLMMMMMSRCATPWLTSTSPP